MNKNISWNQELIIDYVVSGNFNDLLRFYQRKCGNISITKISKDLNCSRRTVRRYLGDERVLPFDMLKRLLSIMEIDQELLFLKMSDQNNIYCSPKYIPKTINGKVIWHGEDKTLVNTLYIYRTQILRISFFEMAYRLEIAPEKLCEFENGKVPIYRKDVRKILGALGIELNELFPQLCSYDGNVSYLPLRASIVVEDKDWDEFYIGIDDEPLCLFQTWPINRYDNYGQPVSNTMPNELSVDEYYNADELLFLKDNCEEFWKGPDVELETLPPNYYRYELLINQNREIKSYKKIYYSYPPIQKLDFLQPYFVDIYWPNGISAHLDMTPFVESCSPWYNMLKDFDYFKKAKVIYADKDREDTQCLIWPHGQYIRINELKMNKEPRNMQFTKALGVISIGKQFKNWIIWE